LNIYNSYLLARMIIDKISTRYTHARKIEILKREKGVIERKFRE